MQNIRLQGQPPLQHYSSRNISYNRNQDFSQKLSQENPNQIYVHNVQNPSPPQNKNPGMPSNLQRNSPEKSHLNNPINENQGSNLQQPSDNQHLTNIMTRIALNYLQNQLLAKEDLTSMPHPHQENSTLNFHFDQQNNQQDFQQGNRESYMEEIHNKGANMNNDFRENCKRDNKEISHGKNYPNYSSPREKNNRFSRDIDERSRSRSNEKKGRFTGKKVGQRTQFKGNKRDERTHKKIERHQGDYNEEKPSHINRQEFSDNWKCLRCGNFNWIQRGICSKCGSNKLQNSPVVKNMENYSPDYQHDNKVFINEGFHHEQYLRVDQMKMTNYPSNNTRQNMSQRQNFGNQGFRP